MTKHGAQFAHLAIETSRGPHVTPVLYTLAGDRLWFMVPRGSLKARVLRRRERAGALLRDDGGPSTVMQGPVRVLDYVRAPTPGDLARLPLTPAAVASYSAHNVRELFGFALDSLTGQGQRTPPDLLLAVLEPDWVENVDESDHEPLAIEVRAQLPELPPRVKDLPADDGPAVVGWLSELGPLALPASWDAAGRRALVFAEPLSATDPSPACLAIDAADSARPTGKRGVMLRGTGVLDPTPSLEVDRVTWWDGFKTGTVVARRPRTAKHRGTRGAAA